MRLALLLLRQGLSCLTVLPARRWALISCWGWWREPKLATQEGTGGALSPPPPPLLTAPAANRLPTLSCSCFALSVLALDNGQGLRPAMGFNSKQLSTESQSLPPPAAIDRVGPSHNTNPLLPLPSTIRSLEHLRHQH